MSTYSTESRLLTELPGGNVIYLLSPELCEVDLEHASTFMDLANRALSARQPVVPIDDANALVAATLNAHDAVVYCNGTGKEPPAAVNSFLDRAVSSGARLFSAALHPDARIPASVGRAYQSFDVMERERQFDLIGWQTERSHSPGFLKPAAQEFSRQVLAAALPTLYQHRGRIFLSHRRVDGEDIAAQLDLALSAQHQHVFRDLLDVAAGEQAQIDIEAELLKSDVVVYLQTPEMGISRAVENELLLALSHDIPVAWIQIGIQGQDFEDPQFTPSGIPHLAIAAEEIKLNPARTAAEILRIAFEVAEQRTIATLSLLRHLESHAATAGLSMTTRDSQQLVHEIQVPRRGGMYAPAMERHIVQVFGRQPNDADWATFAEWLVDNDELSADYKQTPADALLALGPSPSGLVPSADHPRLGEDRLERYVETVLGRPAPEFAERMPGLFISGSFPENQIVDGEVRRAVTQIAREWMSLGGVVVSGGHPTFAPLLVTLARELRPTNPAAALVIYQSDYFAAESQSNNLRQHAAVVATRSQGDRERSLELMRERLLAHEGLAAAVLVGGRPAGEDRPAGVRLELDMARDAAIPTVVLAAPGGEASTIADELDNQPGAWNVLARPPFSGEFLRNASRRTDYRGMIREVFGTVAS
jgi:SLOG cluster3 family/TIR domain